jgi:hypothetical protein
MVKCCLLVVVVGPMLIQNHNPRYFIYTIIFLVGKLSMYLSKTLICTTFYYVRHKKKRFSV